MPRQTGFSTVVGGNIYGSTTTAQNPIGTLLNSLDGRLFRYVLNGAVTLVAGNALQSRIEDVDHDDVTTRVTAAGSKSLLITTGSGNGALDANEYAGGYVSIDTTPGEGYLYRIVSHDAIAASTNGSLELEDAIQVTLSAATKVTLVASPWSKVIQHPVTTATGVCVGGCVYPIPANEYGWIQTGGPGAALIAGTPGAGQPVTTTGATAGALTVHTAELNAPAEMMVTGRSGKILPVFWRLD